ncbi:hypothetical protein V3W47_03345 [Deinococcus sp. YIM 134068]|uniref:hypothetical protein n=1 Tax=Deinococcus lichenicola TaxID=3118910 RepID=UPI002F944D06
MSGPDIKIGGSEPPISSDPRDRTLNPGENRALPALQNAALQVLMVLIGVGVVFTLMIMGSWLYTAPSYPVTVTDETVQAYQKLSDLHQQRYREMFQVVVASAFLPS